jgi:FMN phosphatase YigB (HAD superfamily)
LTAFSPVEEVRKVYQLAVDRLEVPAAAIAFQSSNAWDAYAASAFGIKLYGGIAMAPANPTGR